MQNYQDKLFNVVNGKKHKEEAEAKSGELEDLTTECEVELWWGQELSDCKRRGWQTISAKSQIASILGFMGHRVPVSASQLCGYEVKTVRDTM